MGLGLGLEKLQYLSLGTISLAVNSNPVQFTHLRGQDLARSPFFLSLNYRQLGSVMWFPKKEIYLSGLASREGI